MTILSQSDIYSKNKMQIFESQSPWPKSSFSSWRNTLVI